MSRRLVSQIEKLPIPAKYKRALEGWAAFANNDGTNIYPSKKAVGRKKSVSKWTVYRNTDALLEAGVLFKAGSHVCKNPECTGGKHYWSNGHSSQVYNLDVAMLQNATLLTEKLSSKMLPGQGSKTPNSRVAKCDATQAIETPASLDHEDHSSALSSRKEKMSERVREDSSVAALPRAVAEREQPLDHEDVPQYSKRLGRMVDAGEWDIVMDLYQILLPNDTEAKIRGFDDKELLALAEVDWDIQHRYSPRAMGSVNRATGEMQTEEHLKVVTAQDFWQWNHTHKTGKLKFLTMADMAKAWWSTDPRCGRVQWENDDPDTCPICTRLRSKAKQDNSKGMDNPPASAPVRTGVSKPVMITKQMEADLRARGFTQAEVDRMTPEQAHEKLSEPTARCHHGNNWELCQLCVDEEARRNQCQHGNRSATCYECSHPPNANCRSKECGKRFHAKSREEHFCSPECAAAFKKHNDELAAKYAKPAPAPFNGLAAFLEGQEQ